MAKFRDISIEEWKKLSEEEQKNFKEVIKKTFLGMNKVSMENKTEAARSEKRKEEALKKNFDVMSGIWKQSKITSKAVKVVSNHWGKILGLAIFLLPKKFWTNLRETIYKIYDFFKGKTLSQIWTDLVDNHIGKIAAGIGILAALFAPGAAFMLAMSAFSTGMIALTTAKWFKEKLLPSNKSASPNKSTTPAGTKGTTTKKTDAPIKQTAAARATQKTQMRQTLNTAEKRQAALDRVRGSSPRTAPVGGGWASKFKTAGKVAGKVAARLSPIALVATPVIAAIESQETFRNEGFKKGMAHAIESVTWGLVPRKASETAINAAADGVKIAGTSITKGFINASDHIARSWNDIKTYDYKALLDPIKKQIVDKKKQAMRVTQIPKTMSSLDFADDAQKERLRGRIEKAEQKMLQAKGSKDKAAAGLKLQTLKNELANYGKGPVKTPIVTMGPMSKVNWAKISEYEGGQQLKGYVPAPKTSNSGVTIATGFDLGARNEGDIAKLSPALQKKLIPYLGKKKLAAVNLLKSRPLKITKSEADEIDKFAKSGALSNLKSDWNSWAKAKGGKKFSELTTAQKTVAASIAFQYGSLGAAPKFRVAAQSGRWDMVQAELKTGSWGGYKNRRNDEAAYLRNEGQMINDGSAKTRDLMYTSGNGGTTVIAPTTNNNNNQATTALLNNPSGTNPLDAQYHSKLGNA